MRGGANAFTTKLSTAAYPTIQSLLGICRASEEVNLMRAANGPETGSRAARRGGDLLQGSPFSAARSARSRLSCRTTCGARRGVSKNDYCFVAHDLDEP